MSKTKMNEVKLNEIMREFEFTFHKMGDTHYDYYLFDLPYSSIMVMINEKDNRIEFRLVSGDIITYTEYFKSVKKLRNRLCEAI